MIRIKSEISSPAGVLGQKLFKVLILMRFTGDSFPETFFKYKTQTCI
jgi:hypothetical protein